MNPIAKQMQIGRRLMDVNAEWFRTFAEYDMQSVQKYFALNQEYAQKLPEVRDITGFMDLQRQYGQDLWNGTQTTLRERGEMMREAAEATGEILRDAFTFEAAEEEAPAKKRAPKKAAA